MSNVTSTPATKSAVQRAFLTTASAGSNILVTAPTGMQIRVLAVAVVSTLTNSIKFQSAANDISATFPLGANGGLVLPYNDHGWFICNVGEALNINLGTATSTGVSITYIITGRSDA